MENKNDLYNKIPKNNKPKMFKFNLYWMYGIILMMLIALYLTNDSSATKEVGWTEFQKLAQDNVFDRMIVYNKKNVVEATVKEEFKHQVFKKDQSALGSHPTIFVKIPSADKFSDFYDKAVAENQINVFVFLHFGPRPIVDAPGTAHAHVRSQPGARTLIVFKHPDQHLGAALKAYQPQPLNVGQAIQGASQGAHTRDDFGDRFAYQMRCETAPRHFHFGQFGHNNPTT